MPFRLEGSPPWGSFVVQLEPSAIQNRSGFMENIQVQQPRRDGPDSPEGLLHDWVRSLKVTKPPQ
jgi:hypothetical protein